MQLRTRHLVCFFFLLSAVAAADRATVPAGTTLADHAIAALLSADHAIAHTERAKADDPFTTPGVIPASFLSASPRTTHARTASHALRSVWSMRPPSAQTAEVYAVTSLARA